MIALLHFVGGFQCCLAGYFESATSLINVSTRCCHHLHLSHTHESNQY